jgi:hypothetical protein
VLLLGGSDDDNLFQWPEELLVPQLDRIRACGGNVIRNTMSDRQDRGFEVYPYLRREDGKYDLEQWNPTYWERFRRLLQETKNRGIFVQIEVWDRFDYTDSGKPQNWQPHPYNPANNVNYTFDESGFAQRYPDHPGANRQPFFFTTPNQRNNERVLRYQQRFVNRMLDESLQFDHVLYCMDNETQAEEEWGRYWAQFIKARAAQENKHVQVTEMWDDWNLTAESHKRTFDHPELYDFVDVSQNNHNKGDRHWELFLAVRQYLAAHPRPMNTTKTYGADGNKFGHTDQDGIERFWRHLLAGAASMRFHRPDSGLGISDKAVSTIRAARLTEVLVPMWHLTAAQHLLGQREANEAYAASDLSTSATSNRPPSVVVYFPRGGEVTLQCPELGKQVRLQWISIDQGTLGEAAMVVNRDSLPITAPSQANWVVVIQGQE